MLVHGHVLETALAQTEQLHSILTRAQKSMLVSAREDLRMALAVQVSTRERAGKCQEAPQWLTWVARVRMALRTVTGQLVAGNGRCGSAAGDQVVGRIKLSLESMGGTCTASLNALLRRQRHPPSTARRHQPSREHGRFMGQAHDLFHTVHPLRHFQNVDPMT